MKDKKKIGIVIYSIICVVIVAVCLVIQFVIKNEDKKLQKEKEKLEILTIKTESGVEIETEYYSFDNSKFYLKIPKSFKQLDYETITKKYNGNVPNIVFSNEETTINVAVSLTDDKMSNTQIKSYKEAMENLLKDNSEIISSDLYELSGHNIGKIKLISEAQDTSIYNNMIFFSYNDKLVIVTFNCTTELQKEWQSVGDFIIDSLFFKKVTTTYNLLNSTVSLVYFNNLCTIMYLRKEKNYESRKNRKIYIKTA